MPRTVRHRNVADFIGGRLWGEVHPLLQGWSGRAPDIADRFEIFLHVAPILGRQGVLETWVTGA
jgi:hypothetical protein